MLGMNLLWSRRNGNGKDNIADISPYLAAGASSMPTTSPPTSTTTTEFASSGAPALPSKPSSLTTAVNRNSSDYSPYNQNRYGTAASPYSGIGSGLGGYNSYSSPYSRSGGMGNSMYGGMGGYGGGYGSMYGGMGGYGGMYGGGMGQPGMMGDPNDPKSLTNSFSQSTQATFQIIESLVGAFGGVAQMLESTYMATRSSFFGMSPSQSQSFNIPADKDCYSNGLRRRTILEPPHYSRLYPRHLHAPPLPTYSPRQNNRPTSTRRRNLPHPLRLRLLPRPLLLVPLTPTKRPAHPVKEALPTVHRRRHRPPLPNDQAHPLPRPPKRKSTIRPQ